MSPISVTNLRFTEIPWLSQGQIIKVDAAAGGILSHCTAPFPLHKAVQPRKHTSLNLAVLHWDSNVPGHQVTSPNPLRVGKTQQRKKVTAYFPPASSIFHVSSSSNYFIFQTLGVLKINNLIISSDCYFYLVPTTPHLIQNLVMKKKTWTIAGAGWQGVWGAGRGSGGEEQIKCPVKIFP